MRRSPLAVTFLSHCLSLALLVLLPVALVGASGCDGYLQVQGSSPSSSAHPMPDEEFEPEDEEQDSCVAAISDVPTRLLTANELDNALDELFPQLELEPVEMVDDSRIGSFVLNSRGQVTSAHVRDFRLMAESIAEAVSQRVDDVAPCDGSNATGAVSCARGHIQALAKRAFRRPLEDEQLHSLVALYEQGYNTSGHAEGMRWVVEALLQAPSFMYVYEKFPGAGEVQQLDGFEIAQRMSALLWRSIPDAALAEAASAGELADPAVREAHARRLLSQPLGVEALRSMLMQWVGVSQIDAHFIAQAHDPEVLARSMRAESERLIEHVIDEAGADWSEALSAPYSFVDERLAEHYGIDLTDALQVDEGVWRVESPERAGLLTHASFLSLVHGPIHRGLTIRSSIMCTEIPGPTGIDTESIPTEPDESERSKSEKRLADPVCGTCHAQMDPLGLPFEEYDELGRWREVDEHANPVSGAGEIRGTRDVDGEVDSATELVELLADSQTVRDCVARNLFVWTYGRVPTVEDRCVVDNIAAVLEQHDDDLREALIGIVTDEAFIQNFNSGSVQ